MMNKFYSVNNTFFSFINLMFLLFYYNIDDSKYKSKF